jgi:hypothetical protein
MMNLLERMLDSCEDRFLLYARKIFELLGSRTDHPQLYEIDFVANDIFANFANSRHSPALRSTVPGSSGLRRYGAEAEEEGEGRREENRR